MRECPTCGRQNPTDRDFCECGEYLAWDPTRMQLPAVPKPAAPAAELPPTQGSTEGGLQAPAGIRKPDGPPPAAPAEPTDPTTVAGVMPAVSANDSLAVSHEHAGNASLQLLSPTGEPVEVPEVRAAAGGSATLLALVRNQSTIVDNYDLEVRGVPADWVAITPTTLYLVPYGTSGTYEENVRIELRPPRSPEALAQAWPLEVAVRSRALGVIVARERATLHVEPYEELALELAPKRASGRRAIRFKAVVRNRANAPANLRLSGVDTDDACELRWADPDISVPPGRAVEAPVRALPRKQLWIGRPVDRQLEVTATAAGGDRAAATAIGTVRQKPWLPWWLLIVLPLLIALAILLWMMRPDNVTVPDLRGKPGGLSAQKEIEKAGLKLSPKAEPRKGTKAVPGTVVDQSPEAGSEAEKGSLVTLGIAVGSGKVTVPKLVGLSLSTADSALRNAGLTLGGVQPAPPTDDKAKITYQLPRAGETVDQGTPVAIVFPVPKAAEPGGGKAPAAGGGAGAPAAGGGGGGEDVEVPAITGKPVKDALAELAKAGLTPQVSERAATAPKDQVVAIDPKAGTKVKAQSAVKVVVSAGLPDVVFDDGSRVLRMRPGGGTPKVVLPDAHTPAFSPGGRITAVSGGRLVLLGDQTVTLTSGGDYRDPSWSPAGGGVLASIRMTKSGGELCIGRVGVGYAPGCQATPGYGLGRQISWSPDGTRILAFGSSPASKGTRFGLIEFTSQVPNSPKRGDWGAGKLVTSTATPGRGVISAAFSPDGKRIAAVSNLSGAGGFGVVLGDAGDPSLEQAKALRVRACELAWRPDGRELLLVQSDASCRNPLGDLVRVDPANPSRLMLVRQGAENPAWQPAAG